MKRKGHAFAGMERGEDLKRGDRVKHVGRTLQDDLAWLKKDFERDFTVIMSLNMVGAQLLERSNNLWQKRGLISERDHKQRIRILAG